MNIVDLLKTGTGDHLEDLSLMVMAAEMLERLEQRVIVAEDALAEIACDEKDCCCDNPSICSYGIAKRAMGDKR
jgi:hypothetical protein